MSLLFICVQLVCLDISANKLVKLEVLKDLVPKTTDMTMLNLSNNKVGLVYFLVIIGGLVALKCYTVEPRYLELAYFELPLISK